MSPKVPEGFMLAGMATLARWGESPGRATLARAPRDEPDSFQSTGSPGRRGCLTVPGSCQRQTAHQRSIPMWTKPSYTDLRLGFEVTLYIANR
ncbi:pyrroloquinoline quinone precursor peptide PqqA [Halomonas sp. LBP4]|nr:pyrroloquinoline quinone precursor peptide PqqA [Halomonas sp. LBP4]